MKPPKWWNPRVAAALILLGAFALVIVGLILANDYANAHWGPK